MRLSVLSSDVCSSDLLGKTVQSYSTAQNAVFPPQGATWLTTLQNAAELKAVPTNPTAAGYTQGCFTAGIAQNGICYQANVTHSIVYVRAESSASTIKDRKSVVKGKSVEERVNL